MLVIVFAVVISTLFYVLRKSIYNAKQTAAYEEDIFAESSKTKQHVTLKKMKDGKIIYDDREYDEKEIVGIVKPHGFWTNLIIKRNISKMYISALMHKNKEGFWVTFLMLRKNNRMKDKHRSRS
ncbi:Putative conserved hypothetical protein [Candidatus Fokinia solitaria]|uniref:Uncharacterized protein n=1 Tax=Candidatus Fokinia solitaria TaxID=1802984 RepID=A0A2U8BS95_9RICK|nr:hypothetical protein [Candidatus Fokinia solitaria]AWD33183.1 Putative conserved hypothetical protein [Candidatus Fokinia solitaria]